MSWSTIIIIVPLFAACSWLWLEHHDLLLRDWQRLTGRASGSSSDKTTLCEAYTAGYKEATLLACRRHWQRMRTLRDRMSSQLDPAVIEQVSGIIDISMRTRVLQPVTTDNVDNTDIDMYACDHDAHFREESTRFTGPPGHSSCYTRDPHNNGSVVMWMLEPADWHEEYIGVHGGTLRVNQCTDPRAVLKRPVYGVPLEYNPPTHITLPDGRSQCPSPALWYRMGLYAIDTDLEKAYD